MHHLGPGHEILLLFRQLGRGGAFLIGRLRPGLLGFGLGVEAGLLVKFGDFFPQELVDEGAACRHGLPEAALIA